MGCSGMVLLSKRVSAELHETSKAVDHSPLHRISIGSLLARTRNAGLALIGCAVLTACQPGADLTPLTSAPEAPYRLGVDEQIRIITFGQEQLTGQFLINDRGNVAIPLLGAIKAEGLTTTELERSIERHLIEKKVFLTPSVSVEVVAYRPVYILGEVTKPGEYPYKPNSTVLSMIARAGGYTYRAQTEYTSIVRNDDGRHLVEGKVQRSTAVRPGDVINVFERYY